MGCWAHTGTLFHRKLKYQMPTNTSETRNSSDLGHFKMRFWPENIDINIVWITVTVSGAFETSICATWKQCGNVDDGVDRYAHVQVTNSKQRRESPASTTNVTRRPCTKVWQTHEAQHLIPSILAQIR